MVHSCERDSSAFLPSHVAIEPITKGLLSASLDSPVAIAEQKVSAKRRLKRSSNLLLAKSASTTRLRLFRYLCVSTN